MTRRSRVALAACLLGLTVGVGACGRSAAGTVRPPGVPARADAVLPFVVVDDDAVLLNDNANVFADSVRRVIRDSADFRTTWAQATSRQRSPVPRPTVDFRTHMVVLAAAGRMKLGDAIHVDSISSRAGFTVLVVRTTRGCATTAPEASPFELVKVPAAAGVVQFRERVQRAPECQ